RVSRGIENAPGTKLGHILFSEIARRICDEFLNVNVKSVIQFAACPQFTACAH
ncbi:4539_t:CDS:1, partial [Racocetra persica]